MDNSEGLGRLGKTAGVGREGGGVNCGNEGRGPGTEIFHETLIWSNINEIFEINCTKMISQVNYDWERVLFVVKQIQSLYIELIF